MRERDTEGRKDSWWCNCLSSMVYISVWGNAKEADKERNLSVNKQCFFSPCVTVPTSHLPEHIVFNMEPSVMNYVFNSLLNLCSRERLCEDLCMCVLPFIICLSLLLLREQKLITFLCLHVLDCADR